MWEMIERMVSDRLWIYTGIAGSIIGALFVAWLYSTHIAVWTYGKWAALLNFFVERWGWTWFKQDPDAWRKLNPHMTKKIDELEKRIRDLEK